MKRRGILFSLMLAATMGAQAQEAAGNSAFWTQFTSDPLTMALGIVVVMLFVTIFVLLNVVSSLVKFEQLKHKTAEEIAPAGIAHSAETWLSRFMKKMTDSKPVEKEQDILLEHDYDGIKELDNNLPPWWLYGFYISIIFAGIYLLDYHILRSSPLQIEEYEIQLADAEKQMEEYKKTAANLVDESNVTVLADASSLDAGKAIYDTYCTPCHGPDGGGTVGPNMTDSYWIHGGSINDVFKTIKYGVPEKGMIAWKSQLKAVEMQQVASYILSLQGTTPQNPKAPEGELFEATKKEVAPSDTSNTTETADEVASSEE